MAFHLNYFSFNILPFFSPYWAHNVAVWDSGKSWVWKNVSGSSLRYFWDSLCVIPENAPSVGSLLVFGTELLLLQEDFFFFFYSSSTFLPVLFAKPDVIAYFTFCSLSICSSLLVCFFQSTFRAFTGTPESSPALVLLLSLGSFCRDKHNTHAHNTRLQSPCSSVSTCLPLLTAPPEVTRSRLSQSHAGDLQRFKCHIWLLFPSFENIRAGAAGTDFCFYSKCMGRLHQEEALISQLWMFCPSRE